MSVLEFHMEAAQRKLISVDPISIDLWTNDPVTKNLFNILKIRRIEISEEITTHSYKDTSELADLNRAIGMLEVIDDLLNRTFLDDMKELVIEES